MSVDVSVSMYLGEGEFIREWETWWDSWHPIRYPKNLSRGRLPCKGLTHSLHPLLTSVETGATGGKNMPDSFMVPGLEMKPQDSTHTPLFALLPSKLSHHSWKPVSGHLAGGISASLFWKCTHPPNIPTPHLLTSSLLRKVTHPPFDTGCLKLAFCNHGSLNVCLVSWQQMLGFQG